MAENQFVVLRLGQEYYTLPIADIKEIIQYQGATKLPGTPNFMGGIINLRGKIIPVVDLATFFGIYVEQVSNKRAVIIEVDGHEVAAVVDEVTEVINIDAEAIEAAPTATSIDGEYINGIGKVNERLLIMLDSSKMFNFAEIARVAKAC